jgi:acylphosphatase
MGRLVALLSLLAVVPVADVPFAHRVIDLHGPKDPWIKLLGDVNGDGQLDLIVGGQNGPLVAYLYPDWKKVTIAEGGYSAVDGAVGDVDGDGRPDIVLGGLVWFRNPGGGGGPWTMQRIDSFPAHDVALADLDLDGRLDVVARDQSGFGHNAGNAIHLYRNEGNNRWTRRVLACPHGEGLKVADLNGDGRPDIVIGGRWYENPGDPFVGEWKEHVFAPNWSHPDVKVEVADLNGDGRPDIILAPAEPAGSFYKMSWFEAPHWVEHEIAPKVETVIHGLAAGDIDGDGQIDLVTSAMHQGAAPHQVLLWINQGKGSSWRTQILSEKGSHNIKLGDVGGDGDLDILGANWSGSDQAVELWENLTKGPDKAVRTHLFISGRVQGVGFRASMEAEAKRIGGLVGWVKNLSDGRVEAVIQGPAREVDKLVDWSQKGPPSADVTKVERRNEVPAEEFKSFDVRY